MTPAVQRLLAVLGVAIIAVLLVFFAVATDSWGSMLAFVAFLSVGWVLVHRAVRK